MVVRQKLSVDEYLALPEEKPYLEYIDGEAVPKMAPDWSHLRLAQQSAGHLWLYAGHHGGWAGPEGRLQFGERPGAQFRLPDVAYWAPARMPSNPHGPITVFPTLAVEVRSPGQPLEEMRERCRFYRRHGIEAAWLVDPDARTVELFEAGREGELLAAGATLTSPHLPGFALGLTELFAVLDR